MFKSTRSNLSFTQALVLATAMGTQPIAYADHAEQAEFFEEVTILGNREAAQKITGSAHFLSDEDLEIFAYSDIQRILREVPGVYLQVEDGYGLRPNIGIRGVPTERSSRIVLLEDNVPVAPAPYSASSAYYFPTIGRMYNVEVVKGPSAITQGPNTIGGAINFVSTPIPREAEGNVLVELGEDSTTRVHANYGANNENGFGFLVETHQWKSDGYQSIDSSSNDTGLDVEDYTVKLSYAPEGSRHAVEFKYQYAQQDSDQSYLGLTDADFKQDAFRRYAASQLDNIATEHNQYILRHEFIFSDSINLTTTLYNNEHKRNWFKTERFDVDGSAGAESSASWSNIIADVNSGVGRGGLSVSDLQQVLDGTLDTAVGSIQLRDNNREYYSRGLSLRLDWQIDGENVDHDIEIGARIHHDEEDRLQRNGLYQQVNGTLVLNDAGEFGNAGNRVQRAKALSLYVHDSISFGDWILTPGVRFEEIDLWRKNYDGGGRDSLADRRDNSISVALPGFGALYQVNDALSVLAGVYKGFGSPTNKEGVDEEEAINYEFGARYIDGDFSAELIGFLNDYDNLVGACTASSGSNCDIGDVFNGGAATVSGVEFSLRNRFELAADLAIPVALTYTYTDSEFDSTFDSEFFGDVVNGDPIPYIPSNQATFSVGIENGDLAVNAVLNFVDKVCVRSSCGVFEETDSSTTLDLSVRYQVNQDLGVYARLENATGQEDIVGRQPYGARPNKDRTASVGMRVSF